MYDDYGMVIRTEPLLDPLTLWAVCLFGYFFYCLFFKKQSSEIRKVSFFSGKILWWGITGLFCTNLTLESDFLGWLITFWLVLPILLMVQFVAYKSAMDMSTKEGREKSRRETESINKYECTFGYMERKRGK